MTKQNVSYFTVEYIFFIKAYWQTSEREVSDSYLLSLSEFENSFEYLGIRYLQNLLKQNTRSKSLS